MKYTKNWHIDSELAQDPWYQWLQINAHSGLEYNLIFWEDRIEVEFFDQDQAEAFAQEHGL